MILLALDASTTAIGYAIFKDGELRYSGVYVPFKTLEWWERIDCIGSWLYATLSTSKADAIGYELATGNRGNMHTNRLLGAVEYEARRRAGDLPFHTVTASQVKASGCSKDALTVAEQIKGEPLHAKCPGDEADAIGVGLVVLGKIKAGEMEARW